MDTAFDFIKNKGGLTTEANYPYRAEDGNCDVSVTDKVSMLDEAIEYLKQLQLQVQFTFALMESTLQLFITNGYLKTSVSRFDFITNDGFAVGTYGSPLAYVV
ncbi:hypothetical protein POM88_029327 [Heracleum sosnowskyi]|uniref:Peptidase C1A papain C-terminal domain-containing protein n=1 Tax=Heracleum sosnowskyi TaxID=360622 RepID=A0AAD8HTF7_9APIA|nr:hypothetical protein POM88_029327 [Heracleum sosnowskyi]